ncbi:MFS transporter, partial [Candidatus Peregrinibacteria bacterium]|nr:MFS transporter [Candidatus Peregrinibacteria bacterium]
MKNNPNNADGKGRPLLVVFLTVLIDMMGIGILFPVLPLLLGQPGSEFYILPPGVSEQTGYLLLGLLTAIYPLAQFLATPILGQLSDRYGRRKILMLSLAGTALGYLLFAMAILWKSIPLLFISRALDGVTGGNISVANAAIADITKPQDRAKNFGLIGAAFGLGFIIGPFLGGKLSDTNLVSWFNATTPFIFAAILAVINIISVYLFLPETLKEAKTGTIKLKLGASFNHIRRSFLIKEVRLLFLIGFLFSGGFAFFTTFFAVYLSNKFGFNQGNIGDFFAEVGVFIVITQALIVRKMATAFKEDEILRFSILGLAIGVFLYLVPTEGWQVYAVT